MEKKKKIKQKIAENERDFIYMWRRLNLEQNRLRQIGLEEEEELHKLIGFLKIDLSNFLLSVFSDESLKDFQNQLNDLSVLIYDISFFRDFNVWSKKQFNYSVLNLKKEVDDDNTEDIEKKFSNFFKKTSKNEPNKVFSRLVEKGKNIREKCSVISSSFTNINHTLKFFQNNPSLPEFLVCLDKLKIALENLDINLGREISQLELIINNNFTSTELMSFKENKDFKRSEVKVPPDFQNNNNFLIDEKRSEVKIPSYFQNNNDFLIDQERSEVKFFSNFQKNNSFLIDQEKRKLKDKIEEEEDFRESYLKIVLLFFPLFLYMYFFSLVKKP